MPDYEPVYLTLMLKNDYGSASPSFHSIVRKAHQESSKKPADCSAGYQGNKAFHNGESLVLRLHLIVLENDTRIYHRDALSLFVNQNGVGV